MRAAHLNFVRWIDEHGPHDVGAVALVPGAKGADDGAKVDVLLVGDGAELEFVVAARLDDGWVADLQLGGVQVGYVFLVGHGFLHALG